MYVMDSPKRQEEAMNTRRQSPSFFQQVSWFILRAHRDTGIVSRVFWKSRYIRYQWENFVLANLFFQLVFLRVESSASDLAQARSQPQNLGGSISTSHSHDS